MTDSTEEYCRSIVTPFASLSDLTSRVEDDDMLYNKFCGALACVFDLDPLLVGHLANLDYIDVPDIEANRTPPNYIQLLTMESGGRDVIEELLSYLTKYCETVWREPYQHSEAEKKLLKQAIANIAQKYKTATAYFETVSRHLWREPQYMATEYTYYLNQLDKRLKAYGEGRGYVFDKIVDNKVIYCK